ncbi:LuxS/MPP-like metallohydrolase [Linderina pennispora]|uniref:LuxS/MPP-like metallohydrolase n=1 Tax=Linderina pennispora TaxID=61395 RepID=A0A1Y1VZH0_9FUNG|nr:LuxS/MPP-like metallohydrolase [Linderina pennispora]ORX66416.1 LuxS/MPP-like metallohydrolase [Linderina pennispora]
MCAGKQYTKLDSVVYENGKKDGGAGHIVTMYENNRCGLRVVLCKIPGAMCSLEIIVPTLATDDKGTAHALEHLVLRGSKHYPHCGYLTAFMQRNYCAGRNGMTCADHTVYVASAISEKAIGRLLPVYLDHVINPLLDPQQLPTQVYQINDQGHEGGVVYNEMLSREDKPDDIVIHTMLKKLYPDHSPYAHYPGGYTGLLSTITHKEIVDFHSEFYDPCNITVVIAGSVTEEHIISEVLEKIPPDRFTTQCKSTWGRHCLQHRGKSPRSLK